MAWQPGPGFEQYSAQPGMHPGMQGSSPQVPTGPNNPLNDVFYGAAPGLLGAYLGNSKDYVQSNVSRALIFQLPLYRFLLLVWVYDCSISFEIEKLVLR